MRRALVLGRIHLVRLILGVVLVGSLALGIAPSVSVGQDEPAVPIPAGPIVDVVLDPMPLAPSFLRLIRISMEPGSSIPLRSHPGPKIDRVESGTLTAVVRDEDNIAAVTIAGAEEAGVTAGEDVALTTGDVIVLPVETFYAFRNDGSEPVVLLSTIMLPAGHQRPPGITYADGEPASDAYDGVTNQILGDGVATTLPMSPGRFVIDQVTVSPEQPLAASAEVTLLSNMGNGVDITVDSGRVQVSRTVAPGPQRDSAAGEAYTLITGDGLFFPEGHEELRVPDGELQFTRVVLTGGAPIDSGASTGESVGTGATPTATGAGSVTFVGVPSQTTAAVDSTPLADSSRAPRAEATGTPEEPTPTPTVVPSGATAPTDEATEPTPEATEPAGSGGGFFSIGATVATVDVGVNVRAEPSASAEVVLEVEAAGTRFVVIGEPVEADGFSWVPVQSVDDPLISGWAASDFLAAV